MKNVRKATKQYTVFGFYSHVVLQAVDIVTNHCHIQEMVFKGVLMATVRIAFFVIDVQPQELMVLKLQATGTIGLASRLMCVTSALPESLNTFNFKISSKLQDYVLRTTTRNGSNEAQPIILLVHCLRWLTS